MNRDYVDCDRPDGYCLDAVAAAHIRVEDACCACTALIMGALEWAAGRDLDWSPVHIDRAGDCWETRRPWWERMRSRISRGEVS